MAAVENLVFHDTYHVESKLGSGGMGDVYVAMHLRLKRRVAIKLLKSAHAETDEAWIRFRREAEVASQLGHPNIVQVTDFNHRPSGEPYIVMELLEGEDLASRLERGSLPVAQALRMFEQIGSALAAVHDRGVVHRDLKPPNVFLCDHGEDDPFPKVLDFGVSKIMGSQSMVTADRTVVGTPNYMAPEQAEGRSGQVDARADQFALATILYEMLSGTNPFLADNVLGTLYKVVNSTPVPIDQLVADLPPSVAPAMARAMAKQADDRFDTVREFVRAALGKSDKPVTGPDAVSTFRAVAPTVPSSSPEAFATTFTSSAGELSVVSPTTAVARPKRAMWIGGVVFVGLLVGGGVLLTRNNSAARGQATPTQSPAASTASTETTETVTLTLVSSPQADQIFVDGEPIVGNKIDMQRDDSQHTVEFVKGGHAKLRRMVPAIESATLRVVLTPAPVVTEPAKLDVAKPALNPPKPRSRTTKASPRHTASTTTTPTTTTPTTTTPTTTTPTTTTPTMIKPATTKPTTTKPTKPANKDGQFITDFK